MTADTASLAETPVEAPLILPLPFDKAFDDPARILATVRRNGPYRWVGHDYIATDDGPPLQWYRETWMFDDRQADPERRLLLDHKLFFDGSRDAFVGFRIVRPESVRINLMAPMPDQFGHTDLPYFRGLDHSSIPMHFLLAMRRSGLFERWMINISSGLAWLYEGHDGGLSFWPDGPDQPGWRVAPPLNNRAFISDNQRMYHRVEAFGAGADATTLYFERDAELVADGEGWAVRSGGETIHRYRACEIRISLLWKAIMFKDADAARIHDEHLDDLSLGHAVEIMREEGHRRGIDIPHSADPLHDVDFTRALERAFPTRRTFAPVSIEV